MSSPFENCPGYALAPSPGGARLLQLRGADFSFPLVLSLSKHERSRRHPELVSAVMAVIGRAEPMSSPFENCPGYALAPSPGGARLLQLRGADFSFPLVLSLSKHERSRDRPERSAP